MIGEWPENEIDHFDTIKHHNWWSNLREANDSQNNQNLRKPKSHNTSGYLGVVSRSNGRFQALIGINGKSINLGMFKDPKLAHEAYLTAKRKLHEFNTI